MNSDQTIVRTVSLYQEDWDIIQRESDRLRELGSGQGVSGALRHIIREWDRRQRQSLPAQPEAVPCSPTS